jgi:DNA polymerase III delta subunit
MIYVLGSVSSGVDVGQADLAELLRRGDMSAARQALAKLLREPEPA